ncbi:unnamed protein product [Diatraea saccharalis]|uniref:Uncharacterized protein n=1 Tax=Diatraea saccharalis TaxID=40085 RepID=A0A9N9QXU1_9NEOP|nr:unnamed protein product [Diatraea saccharalis]
MEATRIRLDVVLGLGHGAAEPAESGTDGVRLFLAASIPRAGSHQASYRIVYFSSLLQLHNTGALVQLQATLVPAMPECAPPAGFASARAADVRSALILIIGGLVASSVIGN